MQKEFIDVLDKYGNPTGKVVSRQQVHTQGLWHNTIHIWVCNHERELLFQKRAKNKDTFPNMWDVSVAAHVHSRETTLQAGIRELQEEIGLQISLKHLVFITTQRASYTFSNGVIDNEINYIYMVKTHKEVNDFVLQHKEVQCIKYIPLDQLLSVVKSLPKHFVADVKYYSKIIRMIQDLW